MTPSGCPVGEDLATEPLVNIRARGFLEAKLLLKATQSDHMYIERLKELDLYEPESGLLDLELAWAKYEQTVSPNKRPASVEEQTRNGVRKGISGR